MYHAKWYHYSAFHVVPTLKQNMFARKLFNNPLGVSESNFSENIK